MPKPLKEWIHLLFDADNIPKKIIYRVDAGKVYGLSFGHIYRCLVLARIIYELYGAENLFLMRNYIDGVTHVKNNGQRVSTIPIELSKVEEGKKVISVVEGFHADLLIVDLPYQDLDTTYFSDLRAKGKRIVFIDDCRYISPDVDVVLNSSILAKKKTKIVESIRYLLGTDYFIFKKPKSCKVFNDKRNGFNVIITFGGSDPAGFTLRVLKALVKRRWNDVVFKIILGPGYTEAKHVSEIVQDSANNFQVIYNPADIYHYFQNCDLAICSGGRTLYELQALNIPILAVASIGHEVPVIEAFLKKKLIIAGVGLWNNREFNKNFEYSLKLLNRECV